jgi:hypothetical protein
MSTQQIAGWCLALALGLVALPVLGAETDPPPPTVQEKNVDSPREPPRPMTQSELQREIEFHQRELEELIVRIGTDPPTEEQRIKLNDLGTKLAELRKQLDATQLRDTHRAQGTSFKARWMRVRRAVDDFTAYDLNDGMFRILEVTGRFSTLDLNDGLISGGEMQDVSLGLSWYLTQASRFMLNYIHSDVKDVGTADLALLRFQFNP